MSRVEVEPEIKETGKMHRIYDLELLHWKVTVVEPTKEVDHSCQVYWHTGRYCVLHRMCAVRGGHITHKNGTKINVNYEL